VWRRAGGCSDGDDGKKRAMVEHGVQRGTQRPAAGSRQSRKTADMLKIAMTGLSDGDGGTENSRCDGRGFRPRLDRPEIEIVRREADGTWSRHVSRDGERAELSSVACALPVSEIYRDPLAGG
jgi:hypothetical protein